MPYFRVEFTRTQPIAVLRHRLRSFALIQLELGVNPVRRNPYFAFYVIWLQSQRRRAAARAAAPHPAFSSELAHLDAVLVQRVAELARGDAQQAGGLGLDPAALLHCPDQPVALAVGRLGAEAAHRGR